MKASIKIPERLMVELPYGLAVTFMEIYQEDSILPKRYMNITHCHSTHSIKRIKSA